MRSTNLTASPRRRAARTWSSTAMRKRMTPMVTTAGAATKVTTERYGFSAWVAISTAARTTNANTPATIMAPPTAASGWRYRVLRSRSGAGGSVTSAVWPAPWSCSGSSGG